MKTNADFYEVALLQKGGIQTIGWDRTEREARERYENAIKQLKEMPRHDWREECRGEWNDVQEYAQLSDYMHGQKTVQVFMFARNFGEYLDVRYMLR